MNGKQDVLFRFAAAPKGVETVREPLSFMRRGADAHGAYPDSLAISQNWSVAAQGSDVPVYAVPVTRCGPHSFCRVELLAEGCAAALRLKFSGMLHEVRITPQTDALQWRKEGGDIICKLAAPCTFTVEVNGRMYTPLTVFVEAPEQNIPRREDPNVLWFGPGLHRVSSLELHTGQTLYLASGAVLKAVQPGKEEAPTVAGDWAGVPNYKDFIRAQDSEDIKVLGRGIVDLSELEWHARRTLCFTRCRRVTVDGPVLLGAAHWTAAFFGCEDVTVKNLVIFGYRENSDGIDLVNCTRAQVSRCYIRTGDDAVCIKAMEPPPAVGGRDILVEHCMVWNDKVRALGIAGESRGEIYNIVFRRCTVLHSLADWAAEVGALCVVLCDAGTVHDIVFEQIDVLDERANGINCMLFRDRWSTDTQAGHIRAICFRDISLPKNVSVRLWGYDAAHRVEDILLQNVHMEEAEAPWLDSNVYTSEIQVRGTRNEWHCKVKMKK